MTDRPQRVSKFIAINCDGDIRIHFNDTTGNYATLCGMDGDDNHPFVNQSVAELTQKPRVNCLECIAIFVKIHEYTASDIDWEEWNEIHGD